MILYLIIITLSLISIILCNLAFASVSIGDSFLYTFISLIVVVGIDAVIAFIIHSIPEKFLHPFKKYYRIGKKERKFYEKIGVRGWKDLIPESGKYLCHFAKDKIAKPKDNVYILKFLRETCYAEIMHIISIPLAFVPIFFLPYSLTIFLPVAVVNAFLQILPVIVQRYNRIRLITLYNFNERHKRNVKNEQSEEVCADACAN